MPTTLTRAARRAAKGRSGLALTDELAALDPSGQALPYGGGNKTQKIVADFEEMQRNSRRESAADFPLQALPPALQSWVAGMSRQTQAAPETPALLALAVSAAALARNTYVQAAAGWDEPLNLYVGVLTKTGDQSDTVLHSAMAPLRDLERAEQVSHTHVAAKDQVFLRNSRRGLDRAEREAEAIDHAKELRRIDAARIELEQFTPKPTPRRIVSEVHARSLHYHLAEMGRIACLSPRGEIFRQLASRNNASRERLVGLLEDCHAGLGFTAQLTRGKMQAVDAPSVTIASLLDRSLAADIAKQRQCPARALLSSFAFIEPDNGITARKVAQPIPPEVSAAYVEGIRRLAARPPGMLKLAGDASALFREWTNEIDEQVAAGPLAPIGLWAKKLPGLTLRLAGILHAWGNDADSISLDTIASAIEIARWLAPRALSALAQLGAADDDCREVESAVLRFARSEREFSPREAMQHLRRTIPRRSTMRSVLRTLVERGHLVIAKDGTKFPRRFSLANRPLLLAPPQLPDEFAVRTPAEAGDPPSGGMKAG